MPSFFPEAAFHELLGKWTRCDKSSLDRIAAASALKDTIALLETCPTDLSPAWHSSPVRQSLSDTIHDTKHFLRSILLFAFGNAAERRMVKRNADSTKVYIQSPFTGGVPVDHIQQATSNFTSPSLFSHLGIGILNPGRCGLSSLDGTSVLWWRLWEIVQASLDAELQIAILPSPRLPANTKLPVGFPCSFEGAMTTGWDSVGLLFLPEVASAFSPLPEFGNDLCIWLLVKDQTKTTQFALCCVAAPPGGDLNFWESLLKERRDIIQNHSVSATIIAGDTNIHIPEVVQHCQSCRCSHCRPSSVDKKIHKLLQLDRLTCMNPVNRSTHVSGTTNDLFLTGSPNLFPTATACTPGEVARSDHGLAHIRLPIKAQCSYRCGLGRVCWTSSTEWGDTLLNIDAALQQVANMAITMQGDIALVEQALWRKKLRSRRLILDSFAWIRNAWFVICGHLAGLVKNNPPKKNTTLGRCSIPQLQDSGWALMRKSVTKYFNLRQSNVGAAERFLSSLLKPHEALVLQLTDKGSNHICRGSECIPLLQQEMQVRASSAAPRSNSNADETTRFISKIKSSSALIHPTTKAYIADTYSLYTLEELDKVLRNTDFNSRSLQ